MERRNVRLSSLPHRFNTVAPVENLSLEKRYRLTQAVV
jgi:hypothetical protein